MQQCIDYIKQNEDEIAEYVNSLFLAQKDVIREQLLESLAAMLNPIPTHYEWRSNDCPYDYSGELYEDGKVSLEQTVRITARESSAIQLPSSSLNFSRANILVQAAQPMYLTMVYHITHMGIASRTTPLRLAAPL